MNSIRAIQQLNKRELEAGINPEGSWHTDYRDTAFIYIGGLPFELSEGDVITIFSQFGEPVWIRLARDKETGKSKGFGWLKYEDQRSCDLAVDNLGGATIMDRVLKVDHTRYKPKDDEDMGDNTMGEVDVAADEDGGRRKRQRTESESDSDDDRPLLPEEIELEKAIRDLDEEDPMKESMVKRLQEKAESAIKKYKKSKRKEKERKHHRRHRSPRRDRSRDHDRERRRIKDRDSEDEDRRRRKEHRSRREDEDEDRPRRKEHRSRRGDSEGERRHKSSRPPRDGSSDREEVRNSPRDGRDRVRRDHSRERRRYSSEEEDRKRSRSKRSP
ncbi:RNA-binding domain-containing protein [Paraphaeosphaeria sporulosa]|uniref:RNA-binding domain-containing protein n=1 Tax=Paraphaeosphaeria sporulosa TaxID=1460663 RepID=A0A177C6T0_9PLEO|nr:RNA-binding domain-containing protein [Paraphaeosphaeria sporulosa]OAG02447.1 RNA-binding domain-containing protein [Paraphaeosphaeria sporulosa]